MFASNFMAFSKVQYNRDNLPGDDGWIWNQSSGKVYAQVNGMRIMLQKMNPRKRRECSTAPSYKLWLYTIDRADLPTLYFLWCEKGLSSSIRTFSNPKLKPPTKAVASKPISHASQNIPIDKITLPLIPTPSPPQTEPQRATLSLDDILFHDELDFNDDFSAPFTPFSLPM